MKTPCRSQLDFEIYDYGYFETLERYGLTEEKAELILYGKPEREVERRGKYVPPVLKNNSPSWSMDIADLKRVAGESYETLFKEAQAHIHKTINARAMSPYDVFSLGLERVLYSNADFEYVNDTQTINYIRSRIKRTIYSEEFNARYAPISLEYRSDLLSNAHEMDVAIDNRLKGFDTMDKQIVEMYTAGFTQDEISNEFGVTQQTVSNRLIAVYKLLKTA